MGRSITISLIALALAGCPNGVGACDKQPDFGGAWKFSLQPLNADAGVTATIPRVDIIDATLVVLKPSDPLALGRFVQGTLASEDKGFFDTLAIPALTMNNGSKTGSALGCDVRINVPIATPVSDDNVDQGPLRISLGGTIDVAGHMRGDATSSMIVMTEDSAMTVRGFAWEGQQ